MVNGVSHSSYSVTFSKDPLIYMVFFNQIKGSVLKQHNYQSSFGPYTSVAPPTNSDVINKHLYRGKYTQISHCA